MGRIAVILDPAGYKRTSEPGFAYEITGAEMLRRFGASEEVGALNASFAFYNPPGSPWILPRPLQFDPDWTKNELILDQYVFDSDDWTWATGITPIEWDPSKKSGTAGNPMNKWVSAHIPTGTTSLDSTSYSAMSSALGFSLPSTMITVAHADETPNGDQLSDWDYSPWFSYLSQPGPDNSLVLGFADFAFVFYGDSFALLRTPLNDKQTWELLARGNIKTQNVRFSRPATEKLFASTLFTSESVRANVQSIMALPVGWEDLYILFGDGQPMQVKLRDADPLNRFERLFKSGSWWIGANTGRQIKFQTQVVGYSEASDITDPANPLFDLGDIYKPTATPELDVEFRMPVSVVDPLTITETDPDGVTNEITSPGFDMSIEYTLTDEAFDAWVSNGTHHKAHFDLQISSGGLTGTAGRYLTPQFRRLLIRVPPVLVDRASDPLTLLDTQWHECGAEVGLYDHQSKRIWVDLWDPGLQAISASGHDLRDSYPIHICEDVDNNGSYETIRAAGWIDEPETTIEHSIDRVTGDPIQFHRLQGRGQLSRLDQGWEYLPQIVDPLGDGYIEHGFVVRETLVMSGLDWIDPLVYAEAVDPNVGTERSRLPGTWKLENGVVGHRTESPWAPTWSETRLDYIDRIARLFAGWLVHEQLDRVIRYHPDLMTMIQLGAQYFRQTTLYATHAAALSAGVPGQVYAPLLTFRTIPPVANCIRVNGKDDETNLLPQLLERDTAGIETLVDKDYIGDVKVKSIMSRMAVDDTTMRAICRLALLRLGRRQVLRTLEVPKLAPWQLSPTVVLGDVLAVQNMGDLLLSHIQFKVVKSSATNPVYETRLTLERLPHGAVLGEEAGDYPGSGITEED